MSKSRLGTLRTRVFGSVLAMHWVVQTIGARRTLALTYLNGQADVGVRAYLERRRLVMAELARRTKVPLPRTRHAQTDHAVLCRCRFHVHLPGVAETATV